MANVRGRRASAIPVVDMQQAASASDLASLVTKGAFKGGKTKGSMAGFMSIPKIKMGGCCGSKNKMVWAPHWFSLQGNKLSGRESNNPQDLPIVELRVNKDTALEVKEDPRGEIPNKPLVVITTPNVQIEMLGANAMEAKKWVAALQSSRTKSLWSKGFGNVFDRLMNKDTEESPGPPDNTPRPDRITDRKFNEKRVVKAPGVPLGLTLCGGLGVNFDEQRPHIYVLSTNGGSLSSMWDLRKGDIIVNINKRKLVDLEVSEAMAILAEASERMTIGIARQLNEPESRKPFHDSVALSKEEGDNSFGAKIRAVFNEFDKDGGGTIDAEELHSAMMAAGVNLSKREITVMMKEADADNNGSVDFDEFFTMIQSIMSPKMAVVDKPPEWWETAEEKPAAPIDGDFMGMRKRASEVQLQMQVAQEAALEQNQVAIIETIKERKAAKEALKPKKPTGPVLTKAQLKAKAIAEEHEREYEEAERKKADAKAAAAAEAASVKAAADAAAAAERAEEEEDAAYLAGLPDWKREKVDRARQDILAMPESEEKDIKVAEMNAARAARVAKKKALETEKLEKKLDAERARNAKAGFGRRTNAECISMYKMMITQKKLKQQAAMKAKMDAANTITWEQEQTILNELARGSTAFLSGGNARTFADLFLHHRPVVLHNLADDAESNIAGDAIAASSDATVAFGPDAVAEEGIVTVEMMQAKIVGKMQAENYVRSSFVSYGVHINRMLVETKRYNADGEHYDGGAACVQFIKVDGVFKVGEMWIWNHGFDPSETVSMDGFESNPAGQPESEIILEEVDEVPPPPPAAEEAPAAVGGEGYLDVGNADPVVEAVLDTPKVDVLAIAKGMWEAQRGMAKGLLDEAKVAEYAGVLPANFQDIFTVKVNPESGGATATGSYGEAIGALWEPWLGFTNHSVDNDEYALASEDTVVIKQTYKSYIAKPSDGKPMPKTSCVLKVVMTCQFMGEQVSVLTHEVDRTKMTAARTAAEAYKEANPDEFAPPKETPAPLKEEATGFGGMDDDETY